ncbi:MAG: hypothetical protein WC852_06940 [Candidatus Nanoarchaeia archaeon]|jgi:hypothetical protein
MKLKVILALGLASLLGCKGGNADDYKVKAGSCKQDYECGLVCYKGFMGFDQNEMPFYRIVTKKDGIADTLDFNAGTLELESNACRLNIFEINDEFMEYRSEGLK